MVASSVKLTVFSVYKRVMGGLWPGLYALRLTILRYWLLFLCFLGLSSPLPVTEGERDDQNQTGNPVKELSSP